MGGPSGKWPAGGKGPSGGKGRRSGEVEDAEDREAKKAEFFASLDELLSDKEEALRDALLEAVTELGPVRLSVIASRPAVRDAKVAFGLPKVVGIAQWIQQRIPEHFAVVADVDAKEPILVLGAEGTDAEAVVAEARAAETEEKERIMEEFFSTLPDDSFTDKELALREVLVDILASQGGTWKISQLWKSERSKDLNAAKLAALGKVSLASWIERRLGVDIELTEGGVVTLVGEAAEAMSKGGARGKGFGKSIGKAPGKAAGAGAEKGIGGKGKGGKGAEDAETQEAQREQAKLERAMRLQDFLNTLPDDRLLLEEQRLRGILLAGLHRAGQARPVRLSLLCQTDEFKSAKAALLPNDVNVGNWIENRIGGEIWLEKDSTGQYMADIASAHPPQQLQRLKLGAAAAAAAAAGGKALDTRLTAEDREARLVDHFSRIGPLQPHERRLRDVLVEVCQRTNAPQRLSDVINSDTTVQAAWQDAKAKWMALKPPLEVQLGKWVELRLTEEVKVTREPFIQLVKGVKRPQYGGGGSAYNSVQPPAKAPRTAPGSGPGRPRPRGTPIGAAGAPSW